MRKYVFLFLFSANLFAETFVVDTTGKEGDSLQAAIDSAWKNPGIDTVLLMPGTYHLFINDTIGLIFKDSTILMSQGIFTCTLTAVSEDGLDTAWHVIYCDFGDSSSKASKIKGMLIVDGNAKGSYPHDRGAALFIRNASPILESLVVENYKGTGGAIYFENSASKLIWIYMIWNSMKKGGGLYITHSNIDLRNAFIGENTAQLMGGGIYIAESSKVYLKYVTLSYNISDKGGAIAVDGYSKVHIDSSLIVDNGSYDPLSGAFYIAPYADTFRVNYSNIYYNTYQSDTEIANYSTITLPLQYNFWWDTLDADISAKIKGPNDHSNWFTSSIVGVPREPPTADSIKAPDTVKTEARILVYYYATGFLNPYFDEAVVIVKSRANPTGIAMTLHETYTATGMYYGFLNIKETQGQDTLRLDDIRQIIKVKKWDIIRIYANTDTTKKKIVIYKGVPEIELSDSVKDYGKVFFGDKASWEVWIYNKGSAELAIDSIVTQTPHFNILTSLPDTIQPGASLNIQISFIPQDTGEFFDTTRIYSSDPDESIKLLYLSGKGIIRDIILSDTLHDFGDVKVGLTSDWRYLSITHVGNDTLIIDSMVVDSPFILLDTLPDTLLPNDTVDYIIRFAPTSPGVYEETLKIFSNAKESIKYVVLKGRGVQRDIELSDTLHDFGNVFLFDTIGFVLWVMNAGMGETLIVDSMELKEKGFSYSTSILPETLIPSESLQVIIDFTPDTEKVYSGTLWVYSNDPDEPVVKTVLLGKGVLPDITIPLDSLNFGDVWVADTSCILLWIINKGSGYLVIDSISSSLSFFALHTFPDTMFSGETSAIKICFVPQDTGNFAETLYVYSTDPDTPAYPVKLWGRGIASDIALSCSLYDFGNVNVGDSAFWTLQIYNKGNANLIIDSVKNKDTLLFIWETVIPETLTPGGTLIVTVKFRPYTYGVFEDTFEIYSNDWDEYVKKIAVKGSGCQQDIKVSDTLIDFGVAKVQTTSTYSLKIYNVGYATQLIIDSVRTTGLAFTHTFTEPCTIPAGDSVICEVRFTPRDTGNFAGTLTIYSDDPDEQTLTLSLKGRGVLPDIELKDTILVFDSTLIGDTSYKQTLICNKGEYALTIDSVKVTPPFFCNVITPLVINGFDSVSITIGFAPQDTLNYSADFLIFSDDPDESVSVIHLGGKGYGDLVPPPAPQNLTANGSNPSPWSKVSEFVIDWTNPQDPSGITGAYYKLDAPPESATDGIFTTQKPCTVIVSSEGVHTLYLWLQDGAGNVSHLNRSMVILRYDSTAPVVSAQDLTAKEDSAKEVRFVVRDELSGISDVKFIYRKGGNQDSIVVTPQKVADTLYSYVIPDSFVTTQGIAYRILAQDSASNEVLTSYYAIAVEIEQKEAPFELPAGSEQTAYRMISIPYILENPEPLTVLEPVFGQYDPAHWRLFDWQGKWVEATDPAFRDFAPGRAFFLITRDTGKKIVGTQGITVPIDSPFVIELDSGWNLISTPFTFEIMKENMSLGNGEPIILYSYEGKWDTVNSMEPWKGYAIKVSNATTLQITPFAAKKTKEKMTEPDWIIQITAQCEEAKDELNFVGVYQDAEEEYDKYELYEPPFVGKYVSVYFRRNDWAKPDIYTTDFRPPAKEGYKFDFEVMSNIGSPVRLTLKGMEKLPYDFKAYIFDKNLGQIYDITDNPEYYLNCGKEERKLTLLIGTEEFIQQNVGKTIPEEIALTVVPNPMRGDAIIRFGIPQRSRVIIEVYDIIGRMIKRVDKGELNPGYYFVKWEDNEKSGIYFVRLKAMGEVVTSKVIKVK